MRTENSVFLSLKSIVKRKKDETAATYGYLKIGIVEYRIVVLKASNQ